jgi:hypothetical protein
MKKLDIVRFWTTSTGLLAIVASILAWARHTGESPSNLAIVGLVAGAVIVIVLLGSFYEWIVHRYLYHGTSTLPVARSVHEIHTKGHHWHRFPPDRYVEGGQVERIPVFPSRPYEVTESAPIRYMAWFWQFALYLVVGTLFAFLPIWWITHNLVFTVAAVATALVEFYLFIRVHDVIHYPAGRLMERFRWFQFLDRHHYVHHIHNMANVNFLLPLCDWLFGTLRTTIDESERRRWPTFEEAKKLEGSAPVGTRRGRQIVAEH